MNVLLGFVFVLVFVSSSSALIDLPIFGPKTYERLKGKPTVYTDAFERCEPSDKALLRVTNGDGKKTRVKAARIYVNGTKVAKESDFKQKVPYFEKIISIKEQNELRIVLKSGRHGYLDKLAKYQARKAELEQELAGLTALKDELSSVSSEPAPEESNRGISVAKIESLLKEVHEMKKSHDDRATHLDKIDKSLEDDYEDDTEPESDDEEEIESGWISEQREKLEQYRKEIEDSVKECGKARDALDKTSKKKSKELSSVPSVNSVAKEKDALKDLIKLLKDLDHAIEKALDRLEDIEEKIEKIQKKGPSFIIVEIIGKDCDDTPPVISNPSPSDGALLNTGTPAISAQYADENKGSGIDVNTAKITVDGSDVTSDSEVTAAGVTYTPSSKLPEGEHTVVVSVSDKAHNPASLTWKFLTDTIAPVPKITSHQNGQYLKAQPIFVSGTLDDSTAIVTVNNQPAENTGSGFTLASLGLVEGQNSIEVIATDPAGNSGRDGILITLDTVAPEINVTTPQPEDFFNTPEITVSGTVTELHHAGLWINEKPVELKDGSFSLSGITLIEGRNTIKVRATDLAANETQITVPVTLDTVLPVVTITAPANNILTNNPQITVTGSVNEPIISLTINDTPATFTGQSFSIPYALTEGPNKIKVTATDRAGNPNSPDSAYVNVTLDTIAPDAPVITQPATPVKVNQTTITGTAEANSTVNIYVTTAEAGTTQLIGTLIADSEGAFTLQNVALTEGENAFTATATDPAGNTSITSDPIIVILDTKPPVITVTAPANNTYTNQSSITVTGTVDEQATLTINGTEVTLDNLNFTHVQTLTTGINSIEIIATDLAGNTSRKTVLVTLDQTKPVVTITTPMPGLFTNTQQITITGTVNETVTSVMVGNIPAVISGSSFSVASYTLSDGENDIIVTAIDRAGNEGTGSVDVTLDRQMPEVTLTTPAQAAAGANVSISTSVSDNTGLTLIEVLANGSAIWSYNPQSAISNSQSFNYTLSPDLSAGTGVIIEAKAYDVAGNIGASTAAIQITQAATGNGYIQGEAYDDTKGLRVEGAEIILTANGHEWARMMTGEDGSYFVEAPAGSYLITLSKPNFAAVERIATVKAEKNTEVIDARLTPISSVQSLISSTGGKAVVPLSASSAISAVKSAVELDVPAGALNEQTDLRITPISNQGLAGLLPNGWSPIAAVDIRSLATEGTEITEGTLFGAQGASLKVPISSSLGLSPSSTVNLVLYDKTAHQWIVQAPGTVSSDGTYITASIPSTGQYAFVLPDSTDTASSVVSGSPLPSVSSVTSVAEGITASGRVVPPAAPPSAGLKAVGEVFLSSPSVTSVNSVANLVSGLVVNVLITERFDLFSGDVVLPSEYIQDLVLYHHPCITNSGSSSATSAFSAAEEVVQTTFPVTPSHDYTIQQLLLGKVGIEVSLREAEENGVMVGTTGARLLDSDGNVLVIPEGALGQDVTVPVETKTVAPASLTGIVGSDFTLLRAVEVNLTGRTLSSSAELSIPAPSGLNTGLPIVVAKAIEVKGAKRLKLVSLAKISGSLITSYPFSVPSVNSVANGIASSGVYLFLQAKAPLGFITGTVTDASDNPFPSALVTSSACSLVDLTGANGSYLIASTVSGFTVTATDTYRNNQASGTGTITAANAKVTIDLTIQITPPRVVSVTFSPEKTDAGVEPNASIIITFTEAVKKETITSANIILTENGSSSVSSEPAPEGPNWGNSVAEKVLSGVFSVNPESTVVTFYPSANLKSETLHTLTIIGSRAEGQYDSIQDIQGYRMGIDVTTQFTIRDTTPPAMPPAGSITASFPDANGYVTVTATQGSVEARCTVLIINDTTGEIVTVQAGDDGSFSGDIHAQLGDEIKIVMMDDAGNQTLITYITFKSDDGKYLVTAKGGTVTDDASGAKLEIPEGALYGPTVIKITPVTEDQLPQDNPVPPGGKFLAAVNIDTNGVSFQKAVQFSVPAPANIPEDAEPFVARPVDYVNTEGVTEKVYEIVDSAKVIDTSGGKRLTTACLPFDGIQVGGTYVFVYPEVHLVLISGRMYRDTDQNGFYDEATDYPVSGGVVRSPEAWNYIAKTNAKGNYATYTWAMSNIGTCRDYRITAIDIITQNMQNFSSTLCEAPFTYRKDFIFAAKIPPAFDHESPRIQVTLGPSNIFTAGTTAPGENVNIYVRVYDNGEVAAQTMMEITGPGGFSSPPLSCQGATAVEVNGIMNTLQVCSASYTPQTTGTYTITISASDTANNTATGTIAFNVMNDGDIPPSVPGPPHILGGGVYPAPDSEDISPATEVQVYFNEPVNNVNEATFTLKAVSSLISDPTFTTGLVSGSIITSIEGGHVKAAFIPIGNLRYAAKYEISLSSGIKDEDEGKTLAPYTSTFTTKIPEVYGLGQNLFAGKDIAVLGNYAYIAGGTSGWEIVNIADPEHPAITYNKSNSNSGVWWDNRGVAAMDTLIGPIVGLTEHITYVSGNQYSMFRLYDVTNPAAPKQYGLEQIGTHYTGIPGRLAMTERFAYICNIGVGVHVIDIEKTKNYNMNDPGKSIVGIFDTVEAGYRSPADIAILKGKLYLATTSGHFLITSLAIPQFPSEINKIEPGAAFGAFRVAVAGDFGYIDDSGMPQIIDMAVVSGGINSTLHIINISDPYATPLPIIGTLNLGGEIATDIAINPDTGMAYISTQNGILVIDIKNPFHPAIITKLTNLGTSYAIAEKNGWLYMANQQQGMAVVGLNTFSSRVLNNVAPFMEPDELKFSDGDTEEKKYHIELVTKIPPLVCQTLSGTMSVIDKFGQGVSSAAGSYPSVYVLKFEQENEKCIVKIEDNAGVKDNFILSNQPQSTFTGQIDLSNTAVLFGGINSRLKVEVMAGGSSGKIYKSIEMPEIKIAMDGKRDGTIDVDSDEDKTYLFWVNDDYDVISGGEEDDIDDGIKDSDNDQIACLRDLEDFARVHLFVDKNIAALPNVSYHLKFKNATGTPEINLFEAVDKTADYLEVMLSAEKQRVKTKLLAIGTSESELNKSYITSGDTSPFIFEGKTAGKGDLTFILKADGAIVREKMMKLELKPIQDFYDKFTVGLNDNDEVATTYTQQYSPYVPKTNDYVLFVHGFNMDNDEDSYSPDTEWKKKRWTETMFKRLWWQGYKGAVGLFSWPALNAPLDYDRSEYRAWNSAAALMNLLVNLNGQGNVVRILAHSQGNVVAGQAIKIGVPHLVHTYIASQAALSAHFYDNTVGEYWDGYTTPNVIGHYFSGYASTNPYLAGNDGKTKLVNYFNPVDYALRGGFLGFGWEFNNEAKPNNYYHFRPSEEEDYADYDPESGDRFYYDSPLPFDEKDLFFPLDRYEIFAYAAESRARALGVVRIPTPLLFKDQIDLQDIFGYNNELYSHSRQFRSNIVDEWGYWNAVMTDGEMNSEAGNNGGQ